MIDFNRLVADVAESKSACDRLGSALVEAEERHRQLTEQLDRAIADVVAGRAVSGSVQIDGERVVVTFKPTRQQQLLAAPVAASTPPPASGKSPPRCTQCEAEMPGKRSDALVCSQACRSSLKRSRLGLPRGGVPTCGACRQPGHNRRTCPAVSEVPAPAPEESAAPPPFSPPPSEPL